MAFAGSEIPERHLEVAADLRLQMMHGASEAVGRQPHRQRVPFDEGAIDLHGLRCEDTVQSYCTWHCFLSRSGAALGSFDNALIPDRGPFSAAARDPRNRCNRW